MVQLSRLGSRLALVAAAALLLGAGTVRVPPTPASAGVAGTTTGGGREWLRLIAHELTHVAQFELAGGEGRAEQWLAEGMAEHVAFQVLERLDAGSLELHRKVALVRVQRQPAFAHGRLDLSTLGSPRDFTLRHQREGSIETYHLSFLLADYLIERHGFDTMRH